MKIAGVANSRWNSTKRTPRSKRVFFNIGSWHRKNSSQGSKIKVLVNKESSKGFHGYWVSFLYNTTISEIK